MIQPEAFHNHSLDLHPHGDAIKRILAESINAVAPDEAVRRNVKRFGTNLAVGNAQGEELTTLTYDLEKAGRLLVFGLGKAAPAMTFALLDLLEDYEPTGLLVVKHPLEKLPPGFDQVLGGHPIPNAGSLQAGIKLKELLAGCGPDDLLICLISGGGSAMITSPLLGVSLADMQNLTETLLACGARIDEINTLRRHLDTIKGGGIAQLAYPAHVISLILSDVIASPLEAIASGPTAPDPSTRLDAFQILEKYDLVGKIPPGVLNAMQTANETPKPGSSLFGSVQNVLVGNNFLAAQAAMEQAKVEGFTASYLGSDLQGEARQASLDLCRTLRTAIQTTLTAEPFCLVAGGETTVTLSGNGRGGRNQELALAAVDELADLPGSLLVSLATDGEDGPTDAAGAVVSSDTARRASLAGLSTFDHLANNDAYSFFSTLGDLLKPGPTGTNVNDLTFLFGFEEGQCDHGF